MMPKRTPLPDWTDHDVYLIGGGKSLRGYNFDALKGLSTVGCNQAFFLGPEVCQVCTFGDALFWNKFRNDLEAYQGWVVTNYLTMNSPSWLKFFRREDEGLHREALGWNNNTGALAINVALLLGARRVFLLGFDLRNGGDPRKPHWHDKSLEPQRDDHYTKFKQGFDQVARALPEVYPGRQVINVTDGYSLLDAFPKVTFKEAGVEELSHDHADSREFQTAEGGG